MRLGILVLLGNNSALTDTIEEIISCFLKIPLILELTNFNYIIIFFFKKKKEKNVNDARTTQPCWSVYLT